MTDRIELIGTTPVLHCAPTGPPLRTEQDALDLIGDAYGRSAQWVALPAARLGEDFFRLRSGLAGAVVQKFVNYRVGLAVLGDIDQHTATSDALRDFVRESNRGGQLWFLPDVEALTDRLNPSP